MFWPAVRCKPPRCVLLLLPPPPPTLFSLHTQWRSLRTTALRRQHPSQPSVLSFRDTLPPSAQGDSFSEKVVKPGISRQILFFLGGSTALLAWAAVQTEAETDYWVKRIGTSSMIWKFQSIDSFDIKRVQNAESINHIRELYTNIVNKIKSLPTLMQPYTVLTVNSIMQSYADASEAKRLCLKICLFNAAIWTAWKVKRWQGPMSIRFMHYPLSGLSYTLLTSMFSHRSFFHLLFNCLALESFGSAAYFYLLKEQSKAEPAMLESTSAYHFLSFYISAGVFAGLVSHVVANRLTYPRIIARLSLPSTKILKPETWSSALASASAPAAGTVAAQTVPTIVPSLGASGGIYAAATLTALAFPQSQLALFIPPSYPIDIQWGIGGMVALDVLGVVRGWRYFDHWAHLGGAAFGVAYYCYGPQLWNYARTRTHNLNV